MSFGVGEIIDAGKLLRGEDVVAIYEQLEGGGTRRILENADSVQADIDEHMTFYRHPLENGRFIVDHRILQPVTIDFTMILSDSAASFFTGSGGMRDVYGEIRDLFIAGTFLAIQTRAKTYPNQVIQAIPHQETASMFNAITLTFQSSEIQIDRKNRDFDPSSLEAADTARRGRQNARRIAAAAVGALLIASNEVFG